MIDCSGRIQTADFEFTRVGTSRNKIQIQEQQQGNVSRLSAALNSICTDDDALISDGGPLGTPRDQSDSLTHTFKPKDDLLMGLATWSSRAGGYRTTESEVDRSTFSSVGDAQTVDRMHCNSFFIAQN